MLRIIRALCKGILLQRPSFSNEVHSFEELSLALRIGAMLWYQTALEVVTVIA